MPGVCFRLSSLLVCFPGVCIDGLLGGDGGALQRGKQASKQVLFRLISLPSWGESCDEMPRLAERTLFARHTAGRRSSAIEDGSVHSLAHADMDATLEIDADAGGNHICDVPAHGLQRLGKDSDLDADGNVDRVAAHGKD